MTLELPVIPAIIDKIDWKEVQNEKGCRFNRFNLRNTGGTYKRV